MTYYTRSMKCWINNALTCPLASPHEHEPRTRFFPVLRSRHLSDHESSLSSFLQPGPVSLTKDECGWMSPCNCARKDRSLYLARRSCFKHFERSDAIELLEGFERNPGRRAAIRTSIAGLLNQAFQPFDVSRILETWKFPPALNVLASFV